MNKDTAYRLNDVNKSFYETVADSFGRTRQSSWAGWNLCLHDMQFNEARQIRVLDLACGNQRFGDYVARVFPGIDIQYTGVDNNVELSSRLALKHECDARVCALDAVGAALDGTLAKCLHEEALMGQSCDMAVAFGFMHHVPSFEARANVVRALVESCNPEGYVCLSFWQFMKDTRLARKAENDTVSAYAELGLSAAEMDANDYFLGWQDVEGAYRYCHHFTKQEIDDLVQSVADLADEIDRFEADGRTSVLNQYAVLKRR